MGKQKGVAKRCVYCGEARASVLYNGSSTPRETWIHAACLRKSSKVMLERCQDTLTPAFTEGVKKVQFVVRDTHAPPDDAVNQEEADADGFVDVPGFS